ncbi:response regulator [Pseudonocardia cypriaca]|uniref:response regulator n=1 Tax=Pseudonocardia cypriaca TaxID=882449 RepID=UPI001FE2A40E|nr:response regulator [Pseudonocardia cypriaca]
MDDDERFLAAAQGYLTNGGVDVVGTATNQADALRQADSLQPDVVLVDIMLGDESGFVLALRLVESLPELDGRVMLISTHDEDDFADLIAESPAVGFIPKISLSVRTIHNLLA